jgi:GTP cyclohydrolase I
MWRELTDGYRQDPGELLSAVFQEENGEMVVLKGITFSSICEHHLLPFTGTAAVGYLPQGKIVGISKLARVVECFARRLQVQERMSREIAEAINDHLAPRGVGVFIRGHHSCMGCRGVEQPSSEMITLNLQGSFRSDPSVRDYFLTLVNS